MVGLHRFLGGIVGRKGQALLPSIFKQGFCWMRRLGGGGRGWAALLPLAGGIVGVVNK